MKQAYVSLVTVAQPDTDPSRLPSATGSPRCPSLSNGSHARDRRRGHQPHGWVHSGVAGMGGDRPVHGPVSLVVSRNPSTSYEDAMLEGLARCVGDFVLEWEADPADLTAD